MGRLYRGVTLIGFACFILIGCTMSAAVEPINFDAMIAAEEEAEEEAEETRSNKQMMANQDNNLSGVNEIESSRTEASESDHGLYQSWLDVEESSGEATLDNETSKKRNRVMKASGEKSCRLLDEGVDSSDNE